MEVGRFYRRRVFDEHANSTLAYHLRRTDKCLRENTITVWWSGSQVHMFIRAANMVADDGDKTSDSPASRTTKTLSREYYQLLVGYEFYRA